MDGNFVRARITQLRLQLGVSEYKMSLDLGHSKGYIQSISSGKSLPSVPELLYICEYLGVTPKDFFDEGKTSPHLVNQLNELCLKLDDKEISALITVAECMQK